MQQDTRKLGMAATVWVIAAVVVLALGRVAVPAALIASHDGALPSGSMEAAVPPALDEPGELGLRWPEQERSVVDRAPLEDDVLLGYLPADSEHLASDPQAAGSPAEREMRPTSSAPHMVLESEPTRDPDTAVDPRTADRSPEPESAEAKPEAKLAEAKPKPAKPEAKPKPAEAEPKPKPAKPKPAAAEAKPKPAEAKPKPAEAKPEAKPKPAEAKPEAKPKPTKPKPAKEPAPEA